VETASPYLSSTSAPQTAPIPAEARNGYNPEWLDEVKLDNFTIPRPSGNGLMRPHVGQSLWLSPYGLSLEDAARIDEFKATAGDDDRADERFAGTLFVLGKIVLTWNILDGHGHPYPPPSGSEEERANAFRALPARLITYIIDLVKGDTEGKGTGDAAA